METQQTQIRQCTLADSALVVRVSQQGSVQTVHGRHSWLRVCRLLCI